MTNLTNTTQRAIRYRVGAGLSLETIERPEPAPGTVELRIAVTGLCGTDLHIVDGHMDARVPAPLTPGHETVGVVERLGAEVGGWAPGDVASVIPLVWDGTCEVCHAGYAHVCPHMSSLGIDADGSLQEYWALPATKLVRLPADVRQERAALLEPLAVAIHDLRRGGVQPGEEVVVIGGGPVGSLIATLAQARDARVVVSEPSEWRRAWLREGGLETVAPEDLAARVAERTAGRGVAVVFEVSGSAAGAEIATDLAAVRGRVVVVGVHTARRQVDLHRVFWRELTLIGARVYEPEDVAEAARILPGMPELDRFVTEVLPLERAADAVELTRSGRAMKVLVDSRR